MAITPEDLRAALARALPVRTATIELAHVDDPPIEARLEGLLATLQLRSFEAEEPSPLREQMNQQVLLVRAEDLGAEHLEAYVQGWSRAVARALAGRQDLPGLPGDLAFPELLADLTLTSADAVEAALAEPSRLGDLDGPAWHARLFRTNLDDLGLAEHADALERYITPSLRLHAEELDEALPPLTSKLGGLPDIAPDFVWPYYRGLPMSFIAQLDLAEVATHLDGPLPRRGALYFFYDSEQRAGGYDPGDRGAWRVFHDPDAGERSQPATPPADLSERAIFPEYALTLELEQTVPPLESPHYDALAGPLDDAAFQRFADFIACHGANAERPVHRLLGHPEPVQGDMYTECQLVAHGLYCGDSRHADDPRVPALRPGALSWRLLLQVDTEDVDAMMWGDAGRLYFWIREDDLAAGNFDATWVILQSH